MLIVIPFHTADAHAARELLKWIIQLSGQLKHDCLLVCDTGTPYGIALDIATIARDAFSKVEIIHNEKSVSGWPAGPNSLWLAAAKHIEQSQRRSPWLFLEPDAIPLKPEWADVLEAEYHRIGNPYMGCVLPSDKANLPKWHMNGVGLYPSVTYSTIGRRVEESELAFDISTAGEVVPICTRTRLIHVVWGENNLPPTFRSIAQPGTNIFSLESLNPEAVIFHRVKDGSLIKLLKQKYCPSTFQAGDLIVVVPFCNNDGAMFLKNLRWWHDLNDGKPYEYECLLSYEDNTRRDIVAAVKAQAESTFVRVHETTYGHGQTGEWMQTIAFRHAATQIHLRFNQPFLWTEYDLIPLKKGWIDAMLAEYRTSGKGFAGPIVPGMGHMNGTGIYPGDTPIRIPRGINATRTAWDVAMKAEMIGHCHDIGHLLFHAWGEYLGKLHPFHGPAPSFKKNPRLFEQVPAGAVAFHRCKDGSLIDLLRLRKQNGQ